jgi:RNA polymerase sigma-70 factor, ECF subfamily
MPRATDEEFDDLFRREFRTIVRTIYLVLGDFAAAEDVAQEAFTVLYRHWRKVNAYERPGAWVRRIALQRATRLRMRHRIGPSSSDGVAASEEPTNDPDLQRAILTLPPGQRAAIALHYLEGRSVSEVAEIMDCAEGTVKSHLHRARQRLIRLIGEQEASDVPR